jgi:hypothetical protein
MCFPPFRPPFTPKSLVLTCVTVPRFLSLEIDNTPTACPPVQRNSKFSTIAHFQPIIINTTTRYNVWVVCRNRSSYRASSPSASRLRKAHDGTRISSSRDATARSMDGRPSKQDRPGANKRFTDDQELAVCPHPCLDTIGTSARFPMVTSCANFHS